MPTYEYLCLDCASRVEMVQSFTDEPLKQCDACGGKVRKVIYPVGIQFKGSGFYSTDRRASHPMSRHKSEAKSEETKSNGASESKADAKAEKKSDSKSEGNKSDRGKADSAAPSSKGKAEKSA